ncbi:MAG TPA: L-threonine 3-dehydrogenase [bacterium]|nr:L-threonine 3-dehydrogenase [bacterium]
MRALVKPAAGPGLEIRSLPIPTPGPGQVLVRVRAGGVCGTDLHIERWDPWAAGRLRPPRVIGHEFCGTVVEIGPDARGVSVGDFISGESHVSCGHCHLCRRGEAHICEALQIIGVDRDGAFADYVVVPAPNAWKMAPGIPPEVAAIMDPFGNAVHTALVADLSARSVVVMGCGPIGLCAVLIARRAGATPILAVDVNPYRLALARTLGADRVMDARNEDVPRIARGLTEGAGADVLLEFSGDGRGLHNGLAALRNGGFAALLGLPGRPIELDLANDVIVKGIRLQGIFGRRLWETWYEATAFLASGLDIRPVITHRLPMARFAEAFALMRSGECGKVLLTVEDSPPA